MRKYILQLLNADISNLEKSLEWRKSFLKEAAYPELVKEGIKKAEAKILIVKEYRDKFLNERSSVK